MSRIVTKSSLDNSISYDSRKKLRRKRRRNKSRNSNLKKKRLKKFQYQTKGATVNSSISNFEFQPNVNEKGIMSNWYWSNYRKAMQWQEKHKVAHWKACALALLEENRYLLQFINKMHPGVHPEGFPTYKHLNNRFWHNKNYNLLNHSKENNKININVNVDSEAELNVDDDDDDDNVEDDGEEKEDDENQNDIEFEMSEEMLEFFKQSYKHKMELKKLREQELLCKAEDEIKQLQTNKIKRSDEMKLLYGDGASMIIGMETAVQLSFEKFCDTKSPKYWPNIPFKL